jgi:nitrogen-specific signal transduction histidine kinase
MVGVARDVTEQRRLEGQLRQAQKMEAIGRLAGGVAHDFNNLLTVIGGSTRFALEALPRDAAVRDDLAAVEVAAERATQLTRELLAFSRQQLLKPERLDLSAVVRGMLPMLARLIGEDIAIAPTLAPQVRPVLADPGQLGQVLMNLAVNARDAMPDGGRLVVTTADVVTTGAAADGAEPGAGDRDAAPGHYVRLTVRDTGVGMDEATLGQLFEPFFTTKASGAGTGLGLATVYGIVRQSGGHIAVTSVPGEGTTFTIDLPAVVESAPVEARRARDGAGLDAASGTVLLVEDERAVRGITRRMLARAGYTVLEAENGREALEVLARQTAPVDVVVTDMVMPEMSGRAFADVLAVRYPDVRVLFVSGYTDDEILRRGLGAADTLLLEKPFTTEELLGAVRQVLDASPVG